MAEDVESFIKSLKSITGLEMEPWQEQLVRQVMAAQPGHQLKLSAAASSRGYGPGLQLIWVPASEGEHRG